MNLVAIPSPSCHEAEASAFLVNWMRFNDYDDAYVDDAGNAVGIHGNGARELVLLGHIDTFAGFPPVRCEEGKIYGRGSVDAKGPLCTFAVAAQRAQLAEDLARHCHWRGGRRSGDKPRRAPRAHAVSAGFLRHWRAIALGSHHAGLQGAAAAGLALGRRIDPQRGRCAEPA